jgi:hypothetical protein
MIESAIQILNFAKKIYCLLISLIYQNLIILILGIFIDKLVISTINVVCIAYHFREVSFELLYTIYFFFEQERSVDDSKFTIYVLD